MARITAEDCLRNIESPFALVHAAVRRARQLQMGSKPLMQKKGDKTPVIALREIAGGVVEQIELTDQDQEEQVENQVSSDEEFSQLFESSDINVVLDVEPEENNGETKSKKGASKKSKAEEEDDDDDDFDEEDDEE